MAAIAWSLLLKVGLRHWAQAWKRTLVLVALLSLGVGVFLSIRIASRAAVVSFQTFTESITGEMDYVVNRQAGLFTIEDLQEIRRGLGALPVELYPIAEINLTLRAGGESAGTEPSQFRLTGTDLIAIQNLESVRERDNRLVQNPGQGEGGGIFDNIRISNGVFAHPEEIERRGWKPGDTITFQDGSDKHDLTLIGSFPIEQVGVAPSPRLLLTDISHIVGMRPGSEGIIDSIWVRVEEGSKRGPLLSEVPDRIEDLNPLFRVLEAETSRRSGEIMTQAFRYNLNILGLIALLVGFYLTLQALEASVVFRRKELAILISLGTPAASIRISWLAEALLLGFIGAIGGIIVGFVGAQLAVESIRQTVETLYQSGGTDVLGLTRNDILLAFLLGGSCALLAGWLPAKEASETPPARLLKEGRTDPGFFLLRYPLLSLLFVIAGFGLALLPGVPLEGGGRFPLAGYAAAFCWLIGGSGLAANLLPLIGRGFQAIARNGPWLHFAGSRLRQPTGRHRLSTAGLFVALGMATGMGILIHSFESTIKAWIGQSLPADIYLSASFSTGADARGGIDHNIITEIQAHPGVERSSSLRLSPILYNGLRTDAGGTDLNSALEDGRLLWVRSPSTTTDFTERNPVRAVISESFSERFRVRSGQEIKIPTPRGKLDVEVVGIYASYGNERGTVLLNSNIFTEFFGEIPVNSLAVFVSEGKGPEAIRDEWIQRFPFLSIETQEGLRNEVLRVFHQTFAITYSLQIIGIVVAVAGLGLGLVSIFAESKQDISTLRALGSGRRGISRLSACEGAGLTLAGSIGGLIVGILLGVLLTFVINKQSFGWTLQFSIPWGLIAMTMGLTLLTALVVSARVKH